MTEKELGHHEKVAEMFEGYSARESILVLLKEVRHVYAAIRRHRDQRGDDRCWMDDEELYAILPEGYTPPARDSRVELSLCERFIASRHNPKTAYVSPQRRIEELEKAITDALKVLKGDQK